MPKSGTSLYFFDFDNHVFELDCSDLEQELDDLAASGAPPDQGVAAP